ncbi:hypothetical protein MMC07_004573 [Pseudocyphellaria aurata]|nr:hypothetical protein [Pseudocyphellaria aurata]
MDCTTSDAAMDDSAVICIELAKVEREVERFERPQKFRADEKEQLRRQEWELKQKLDADERERLHQEKRMERQQEPKVDVREWPHVEKRRKRQRELEANERFEAEERARLHQQTRQELEAEERERLRQQKRRRELKAREMEELRQQSPALRRFAAKYPMLARMLRHGIHAFLEVLRHRLPESLDHMLASLCIAHDLKTDKASASVNAHGLPERLHTSKSQRPYRRGHSRRRNDASRRAFNKSNNTDPFDDRECLFEGKDGRLTMPALANLDTGLKVPGGLIMSSRYAKEIGMYPDISKDFVDPYMQSISGHHTPVTGVLRNVKFRLKGTSITFVRDFYVCDAIDPLVDIMIGASFINNLFNLLFEDDKGYLGTFATWFSTKKETEKEKQEREQREREQKIKGSERENARLQKEKEQLEAQQRRSQPGGSL